MTDRFRDVEHAIDLLRRRSLRGEISQREFIDGLRKLRIRDDRGRFWTMGIQSGQWYCYDGREWVQAEPPALRDKKAICVFCGFENDLEAESCARCGGQRDGEGSDKFCQDCGAGLNNPEAVCPSCGAGPGTRMVRVEKSDLGAFAADLSVPEAPVESPMPVAGAKERIVRSVSPVSCLLFAGALGVLAGGVAGLLAGVTGLFPGFSQALPAFFRDIQGTLWGGLIFAALGVVSGFLSLGLAGLLVAGIVNAALSFVGGIRIRLEDAPGPKGGEGSSVP